MANFKTVATTDELNPGEAMVVEHGRMWVLISNVDGEYYAIEDRCSHADVALSDGEIDLDACTVRCPKHGSRFDLKTGEPLDPPAVSPVILFDVNIDGTKIQVARREHS
ncbi:MAG: non-heme iron oxygenase ferredoxin subunit [Chloroflexota bacterium]